MTSEILKVYINIMTNTSGVFCEHLIILCFDKCIFCHPKNMAEKFSESSGETRRLSLPELAAKDLCAQESKDAEEEKEEDEEGDDGLYRIDQRAKEVLEGTPVPAREPKYFLNSRYFLYSRFFWYSR